MADGLHHGSTGAEQSRASFYLHNHNHIYEKRSGEVYMGYAAGRCGRSAKFVLCAAIEVYQRTVRGWLSGWVDKEECRMLRLARRMLGSRVRQGKKW